MSEETHIVVHCRLDDCVFYTPEPGDSAKCRCVHKEKHLYLNNIKCPLYRVDFRKRTAGMKIPKIKRKRR